MKLSSILRSFVLIGVMLAIVVGTAMAQEVASVTGVVTDASGAVVPGVQITLLNTRTNATYTAVSSPTGTYTLSKVLPGPGYKLTFTLKGFETLVVNDLYLAVGAIRTQNAELKIGGTSESVEVSAVTEDITLNTTNAAVGNNFNMPLVSQLPVQIRDNPASLLALQPGVVNATGGSDGIGSRAGSVTGARGDQNNVTLDGLDVNDFATGQAFSTVANAPVDSIQEFRGETAGSLAASGRGSGGQIQMVTKGGSNVFHGSLGEYHRNTATAANTYFNEVAGLPRPKLIRNQFGATLGGPIVKDKLFFFFSYNGRRDAYTATAATVVPLDSFRNGNISYILANASDGSGACNYTSRKNTTPQCIGTMTSAQVAALDPQHVGINSALMNFVNGRYPHANDLTGGDGINTGYYRFNAPVSRTENDYVSRIDYSMSNSMKLFGRFSILRDDYGDNVNYAAPVQFPGDPLTHSISNKSWAYVIGHTWTINANMVNQFTYGKTVSDLSFPTGYNPTGTSIWSFGPLTSPYSNPSAQGRKNPIPTFKDDLTWQKGNHQIQLGGIFKPIKTTSTLINDYNTVTVGLGGLTSQLNSTLRPADMRGGSTARGYWDSAFAFALGRLASVGSNWNYDAAGNVLTQGSGAIRQYRYYETEPYIQDTWKITHDLTLTYGLRYQYYSVPFEVNGREAVQNFGFNEYLATRIANGLAGVSGVNAVPITMYNLGGAANNTRGLYEPNLTNFAPRLSFAYNPGAKDGLLKTILGDRKTVIRGGAGIVYDHPVTNALNFIQDQNSYMFQASSSLQLGASSANTALLNDPRFTALSSIPTPATAPTIDHPFIPFVTGGVPTGLADNQFNYAIDPKLKTPYSVVVNFGFQRELPKHFVLESTYVGRFGRRLLAQADASQLVDFKDPVSGQMMSAAFANLETQVRNGAGVTGGPAVVPVPWFENQIGAGGTAWTVTNLGTYLDRGDIADAVQALSAWGALDVNVGMPAQFAGNTYITNKGSSNYHGLLTSLHKNMSHGLQFDLNYTLSHSIDNVSAIANSIASSNGMGFVCDAQNLRICRGNSDFDMTHIINGNFLYELPFGKGKMFGSQSGNLLNHFIGGWTVSGVPTWRTGIAFSSVTSAYLMGYANNAPAIFNGDAGALKVNVHRTSDGTVQLFSDPDRAAAAFSAPTGFTMGSRNNLRGPGYFNVDLAVGKKITVTERVGLQFRSEAYNLFNHPNFGLPGGGGTGSGADISSGVFGKITGLSGSNRVMQFSLRLEF